MRILSFVPALLLFFFLLGSQVTLLPGHAYAYCCGCTCMSNCTCDGSQDSNGQICYVCRSPEPILQTNASIDKVTTLLNSISDSVLSAIAQSDITQIELTIGRKCFRDKVALSLLGQNRDALKLVPIRLEEKNAQDQILAFQVKTDKGM